MASFDGLDLKTELLRGVYEYGFRKPSPIQSRAMLPLIEGKDTIAQAESGTGKTFTFIIGTLQLIECTVEEVQALVLAPKRELALQI